MIRNEIFEHPNAFKEQCSISLCSMFKNRELFNYIKVFQKSLGGFSLSVYKIKYFLSPYTV